MTRLLRSLTQVSRSPWRNRLPVGLMLLFAAIVAAPAARAVDGPNDPNGEINWEQITDGLTDAIVTAVENKLDHYGLVVGDDPGTTQPADPNQPVITVKVKLKQDWGAAADRLVIVKIFPDGRVRVIVQWYDNNGNLHPDKDYWEEPLPGQICPWLWGPSVVHDFAATPDWFWDEPEAKSIIRSHVAGVVRKRVWDNIVALADELDWLWDLLVWLLVLPL